MGRHNFDEIIERRGTDSIKWQYLKSEVLPMWVADSDFKCPAELLESLEKRLRHGIFGYALLDDMLEEAVAHWMQSRFGWRFGDGCVAQSPGVCTAFSLALESLTSSGDGIAAFTPSYPPLINLPARQGRVALHCPLVRQPEGYAVNFADLEAKLALDRCSLLVLCNPHNPTGKVFSREELLRMGELCLRHNVLIFSDEIHCDYVHKGRHCPIASLSPEIASITLTAVNPSKTFNIAGLYAAAVISPNRDILARFRQSHARYSLHTNVMGALALHTAYRQCAWYADEVAAYTRENLAYAVDFINRNVPAIKTVMPEGTYLLWADCSGLGLDQSGMVGFFLEKARVAPSPGWDFGPGGQTFVRLNLACPRSLAQTGLERIAAAAQTLRTQQTAVRQAQDSAEAGPDQPNGSD
ncbi:MAG: pyridoxal phosphate-dependent aminotransferase [Desulfovibrio sp.]|jgi:cystathionine beta-lyase|nr:pyridoxal phosphate-dependent aminotransferase [Desulfovibrio sp.]